MSDALDVLNVRLAKGEISNEDYTDLLATIRRTRGDDGPNVALILVSAIGLLGLYSLISANPVTEPSDLDIGDLIWLWPAGFLIWLSFALWIRALWNNIVPRVVGWKRISYWDAAGLILLVSFAQCIQYFYFH